MLKNIFKNTEETVVDKIKNPILGTFFLSWLIHHWEIVYAIFSFDSSYNFDKRLNFVSQYFEEENMCTLLWFPMLWALLALIVFLSFQNVGLLLSTFFSRWVKPYVFKVADKNKIIDKNTYKEVRAERNTLRVKFDQNQEENAKLKSQRDSDSKRIIELQSNFRTLQNNMTAQENEIEKLQSEKKQFAKEILSLSMPRKLNQFFEGKWKNTWQGISTTTGQGEEIFRTEYSDYIVKSKVMFTIDMVEYNPDNSTLKFRKTSISDNRIIIVELEKVNPNKYKGIETVNNGEKYNIVIENAS